MDERQALLEDLRKKGRELLRVGQCSREYKRTKRGENHVLKMNFSVGVNMYKLNVTSY
jgi:hypothetical protein